MKALLKKEYQISDINLKLLNDNREKFLNWGEIEKDLIYTELLRAIFKKSIGPIDYKLNWQTRDFESITKELHCKAYFLICWVKAIQESKTYKETCFILFNQHSESSKIRNSILLMIDKK